MKHSSLCSVFLHICFIKVTYAPGETSNRAERQQNQRPPAPTLSTPPPCSPEATTANPAAAFFLFTPDFKTFT